MKPVSIPTTDVNSETCIVTKWHVANGVCVEDEQLIVEVETSKAVIEIRAPKEGYLCIVIGEGIEIELGETVGWILDDPTEVDEVEKLQKPKLPSGDKPATKGYRATRKAEELAAQYGIDLTTFYSGQLITTKDVEIAFTKSASFNYKGLPPMLTVEENVERVMIIGGGRAATQILEIFYDDPNKKAVGILDDNSKLWGNEWSNVPIVGGTNRLEELFKEKTFDSVIISISTSIQARKKFRQQCNSLSIKMTNAIDRTCKIAHTVKIGTGNVICAFCHIGAETVIGNNNFISAYNSFDHHCVLGDDISTGPGCISSGIVNFGNRIRMGAGVFFEPFLEICDDVQVASGAIIMQSIPANHIVKVRVGQTIVVESN